MKKIIVKKNNTKIETPRYKYVIATLISVFIIIIPFVSYLKISDLKESIAKTFPSNQGILIDFFLYYKEIMIIVFSIIIILFFVGEKVFPDKKQSYPLQEKENKLIIKLVLLYSVVVLISTIFSKYKTLSIMGSPTEREGVFVLIGYMILFLAGVNYFYNEKAIKILKISLLILMGIIVTLSLVEFMYKPIFEIAFFKNLLTTNEYSNIVNSMENKFFKDMISLTMYNPNYLGGLSILLFPISITTIFNDKNKKIVLISSLLSIGMIFVTFASKSTGPIYILLLETIILTVVYRKNIRENLISMAVYMIALISLFLIINIISDNKLINIVSSGIKNSPSIVNNKEKFILKDINMDGNILEIIGESETLKIKSLKNKDGTNNLKFFNQAGEEVKIDKIESKITFIDRNFKAIKIEDLDYGITIDIGYNESMPFYITEDGFRGVGQSGTIVENIKIEKPILKNIYPIATGRGYTWVNTVPMIKNNPILGTGPGTFAMYFQQNDYVGLMNTHGSVKFVIDKPHNMYLQILTQTGVVSLIAILLILAIIIKKSIRFYINERQDSTIGIGIFIGCVGFLIVGLVNDSIVVVNPIFWVLLGVNLSIINSNK